MTGYPKDSGVSLNSFFTRCKLPDGTRNECDAFIKARFSAESRPAPFQGYCSYTVVVGDDKIVQFRPPDHSLDIDITSTACEILGDTAPETEFLGVMGESGLHVYSMRKLQGVSPSDLQCPKSRSSAETTELRRQVVRDFSRLQAAGWNHRQSKDEVPKKGLVGSSLQWRAEILKSSLPDRFKRFALSAHRRLQDIEALPWVLTHGDFLPANVLVCPESGKITGLLDWAEAEWLPFGTGLYGLEELLGEDVDERFRYYQEAPKLRELFWSELLSAIPELSQEPNMLETVREAQVLGILLWHGIAFDDGKLNRVVEDGVDDGEIWRLDEFLLHPSNLRTHTLDGKWRSYYKHIRKYVTRKTQNVVI